MSDPLLTGLALLRKPFEPNQINKLPKPTKAQTEELKRDFKLGKRCDLCGGWHQPNVVHLDYVGHAALTDRLLDADPAWYWEPAAVEPSGHPVLDGIGGMWIKLTVCGVTRLGYGHAGNKEGGDAIKEIIGDALRNAAMRFGAALDLWHKGQLHVDEEDTSTKPPPDQKRPEDDRTLVMKIRQHIADHLTNDRELGAMQAWGEAKDLGDEMAKAVWAGLTTPHRDQLRALSAPKATQ